MKFSRMLLFTLLASSTSFFIACSEDSDDEIVVEPAPPSPTPAEPALTVPEAPMTLVGNTYVTPCLAYEFLDLTSMSREISLDANGNYITTNKIFLGDTCGDFPYLTIETKGTFVAASPTAPDQTIMNIDFTQTESFIWIGTERIQTTFNANSYCGKSDWKIDERVNLASVSCDFVPNANGATVNDIYSFEDGSLYFGENFSTMPKAGAARPASIDRNVKYGNAKLEAI